MKRTLVLGLVGSSVLFALWAGCGSSSGETKFTPSKTDAGKDVTVDVANGGAAGQAGQAGAGGGGGGGGGGSGQGGAGIGGGGSGQGGNPGQGGNVQDSGSPDVFFGYDAPLSDVPVEACATVNVEAKLKPLDMYFMIDRSASMADGTPKPWDQQAAALNSFWSDNASAGITAALRFFPMDDSTSPQDYACTGNLYATPLVTWGLLPGHQPTLAAGITSTSPGGLFTPTQEALNGVLKGARTRQLVTPGHVVVAVLVSDGAPCCMASQGYGCQVEDANGLKNIAQSFYNTSPSIRTFTLYVASAASAVMTSIAQGGGTTQSYDATNTANFLAALKNIQGTAIPCDFDMPKPDAGLVNLDQVTLTYDGQVVPKRDNANGCAGTTGWYFDNNTNPTKIIMCPATCNAVKANPSAKVDISLGCLGS